jgi:hypothetical protein
MGIAQPKALPDFLIKIKVAVHFEKPNALVLEGIQFPLRHIFTSHFA